MATAFTNNTVTKLYAAEDFAFDRISASASSTEYTFDWTDCEGEVQLIVDATACDKDVTVVLNGGDYPPAFLRRNILVNSGTMKIITLSSGESLKKDGKGHVTFSTSAIFNNVTVRAAVVKHRMVTSH